MSSEMREVEVLLNKWLVRYNELIQMDRTNEAEQVLRCINEGKRTLLARTEAGAVEKRAPVQRYHGKTIPWRVHGLAWEAYAKKYGSSQSADRIAERGGFGVCEMDEFLPGWREMAEGTHPQDASGDAREAERYRWLRDEASRAQLEMFADRRGTRLAADRLCDAGIDIAAMQAKEAK